MTYMKSMYGHDTTIQNNAESVKNPNRIAGGLRGQGVDHFTIVNEQGTEEKIPTHRYVQSLMLQLSQVKEELAVTKRRLNRLERTNGTLNQSISSIKTEMNRKDNF